MDNVGRILKDRHINVNGLLALICDALDIPFTALFDFAGEVPHGPLKGMTSADIYRACDAAGTWHTIGKRPGLGKRPGTRRRRSK